MAHEAAARDAAWLDKRCPDWLDHIDLDRLNLAYPTDCVLGQTAFCLLGKKADLPVSLNYWDVASKYRLGVVRAVRLGFNVPFDQQRNEALIGFEMLTIAWVELIRNRLAAKASESQQS